MEMRGSTSMKSLPRRWASPRMGKVQQVIDCWFVQLCLLSLASAHCIGYLMLVDDSLFPSVSACSVLNVTGWLVIGLTSSEFLIRVMAQGGHLYLYTSWRRFLRPLFHKVEFCILVGMFIRMVICMLDCERDVENIDRVNICVVLAYRLFRWWGIMYDISVWATETILQRTNRLHTKQVRLDEALWPEDFKAQRERYNSRTAVRMQDFLNTRLMQIPIVSMLLLHCVLYVIAMDYAFTLGVSWIIEAVEVTGFLVLCLLLVEFTVRCIAREGELFFAPFLHKLEALFLFVGSSLVLYATLYNRWMRGGDGREGWEPDAWATLSILAVHRILRFFGIALDKNESEYGVSSVLDAKAIKLFLGFVGNILEISPQNVHFKIPSPTQADIEVWIMKARLKSEAFEALHLPIAVNGGLVEELFVRLPRPRIIKKQRHDDEDSLVTNVRVRNLLLLLGPGGGLAEAGGCSNIEDDEGYWNYETISETKWRLVDLISRHLNHFVQEAHQSGSCIYDDLDDADLSRRTAFSQSQWKRQNTVNTQSQWTPAATRSHQTPGTGRSMRTPGTGRTRASTNMTKSTRLTAKIHRKLQSRLEALKTNFQALFKDMSLAHVVVSVDNVMLQYEDTGSGLCGRRSTIGVKVGNISIHRHQDHHITCDATRFRVLMKVDRCNETQGQEEDVGFWWESSERRLSGLLRQHPREALRQMKRLDRKEWFRSWFFEALDRQSMPSDRQLHHRIERWPERHEVVSFLKVSLVGRPKAIIRFSINGELHIATILAVRECRCNACRLKQGLELPPEELSIAEKPEKHVMTHQIRFLMGAIGERWVCLDYNAMKLSDEMENYVSFEDTSIAFAKENMQQQKSEAMATASSWTTLNNSNDVRDKSRRHSDIMREKSSAPSRKTIVQTFRKSIWSSKKPEAKKTVPTRSWVYSVDVTPIRLTCDNEQICYLNDWHRCLKAWRNQDNAFRWRPNVQAIAEDEIDGVRSMTARLWWIYATHRVLAQRSMRFQAPLFLEVAWRSVNVKKYSELVAEVTTRSRGDYQAMRWHAAERELAKELQVRLTLGSIVEARRNILQDVLTKLAREKEERSYASRYGMLANLNDQALWEDVAQKAAEKLEKVDVVVEQMVEDAKEETAARMQEVGGMMNSNLKTMRTTLTSKPSFASSRPRRKIRFIQFDSFRSASSDRPKLSPTQTFKSFFGFGGKRKSTIDEADSQSSVNASLFSDRGDNPCESRDTLGYDGASSEAKHRHSMESAWSCRIKAVASTFHWTPRRSSVDSRDSLPSSASCTSSISEAEEKYTGTTTSATQPPNLADRTAIPSEDHGMVANLAGEWKVRLQGVHVKLLRSCGSASPRPVILNAKLSGLVSDLGVLLPTTLDAFNKKMLTAKIEQEYADLDLFPYSGLFAIEDVSVVCPDAKKLTLYGRRDLCNIVRSLTLPEPLPRFLTGDRHSALIPLPESLAFAAHVSMIPTGEDAKCNVIMHSADMWFVLYEPVLKLLWEYLSATEIPSYRPEASLAASTSLHFDISKTLPPSSFRRRTGSFVAFDRRFGPMREEVVLESARTPLQQKQIPESKLMHTARERLKRMANKQRFFERLVGKLDTMLLLDIDINLGAMHVAQVGSYLNPGYVMIEEYRIHPCCHRASRGESLSVDSGGDGKRKSSESAGSSRSVGTSSSADGSHMTFYDSMKRAPNSTPSFERMVTLESKEFSWTSLKLWDDPMWKVDARRMSELVRTKFQDVGIWSDPLSRRVGKKSSYVQLSFQGGLQSKVQSSLARDYSDNGLDGIIVQEKPELRNAPHLCDATASISCTVSAQLPSSLALAAGSRNSRLEENVSPNGSSVAESRHARSIPESALCCCTRESPHSSKVTASREQESLWLLNLLPSRTAQGHHFSHWTTCSADPRHSRDANSSPENARRRRQLPAPPASKWRPCEFCGSGGEQQDLEEQMIRSKNDEFLQLPGPPQWMASDCSASNSRGNDGNAAMPCAEILIRVISSKDFASGWLQREALNWCLQAGRGTGVEASEVS